ncbi:MAG: hypothetical protein CYG60_12120 [Actinobacteria bacterium]|nr:MAG: hypothetical protein CYG60_12120 [Actinomycetota bacterium]
MLAEGKHYTRNEIHAVHGGGIQGYLPHKDGRVVAGCFGLKNNPEAPEVVLVGSGPQTMRWAEVLCGQEGPIPVFLKRRINEWEYVGEYEVDDWTEDPGRLAQYCQRSGRSGLTRVFFLSKRRAEATRDQLS